jgi:DNA-directed RNA polymerase subunit RPC12/RpoP
MKFTIKETWDLSQYNILMAGRDEIEWAPRVPKGIIRRLYVADAAGMLDDELLNEVGTRLYQRCRSILEVDAAKHGRVRCPRCDRNGNKTIIERSLRTAAREAEIACPVCGWRVTWRDYMRTYKRRQLNLGGAADAFEGFTQDWNQAHTPPSKMLAIDRLIHAFHHSFQKYPDLPSRPAGVNLINGKVEDVIQFLNELSFGEGSTPEVGMDRAEWRKALVRYRHEYLGKMLDHSQDYFWTGRWQEGEREAVEDILTGHVKKFENKEDLFDDLEFGSSNSIDQIPGL